MVRAIDTKRVQQLKEESRPRTAEGVLKGVQRKRKKKRLQTGREKWRTGEVKGKKTKRGFQACGKKKKSEI